MGQKDFQETIKMKDRLFIFLTIVLLILFAVNVLENASFFLTSLEEDRNAVLFERAPKGRAENSTAEIISRLEQAGLEPREAKYYRIYNE